MKRSWRGTAVLLGWPLLAAGLCGCDPTSGVDASGTTSTAGLSAPAPACFGPAQQPQLSPAAASLMAGARDLAAIGPANDSSPDADLRGVQEGRVRFDGAGRQTGSSIPASAGKPMQVHAGMAIDTDGRTTRYDSRINRDPDRQAGTSLRYSDGSSLNPADIPYVVVPKRYQSLLGDLVVVEYNGRRVLAVVGDCGPRFGEGSVALAERLGIPSSGVNGGVSSGVTYSFYAGSGRSYSGPAQLKAALLGPVGDSGTRLAAL